VTERTVVPCNGCTACCRNEQLILHPEEGDDVASYLTRPTIHPIYGTPAVALQQKPNGDCIYLGPSGCSIWERAPGICRAFDCRGFLKMFAGRPAQRRAIKSGLVSKAVLDAAKRISK
jgi:Fe-S-cluster containining protein